MTNWTGNADQTTWADEGNWDNGVPSSGNSAVIGENFTVNIDVDNGPDSVTTIVVYGTLVVQTTTELGPIENYNGFIVFADGVNNSSTITGNGNVSFQNGENNGNITATGVQFNETCVNTGTIVSNSVEFNASSQNDGTITGTVIFRNSAYNNTFGNINGNAIFYDNSFNAATSTNISGFMVFPNWVRNGNDLDNINTNMSVRLLDVPEGGGGDILGTGLL